MADGQEWYSDREMFEMIQGLKSDLAETRSTIKKYNGLWEKLEGLDGRLVVIEQRKIGGALFSKGLRDWAGWLVGIAGVVIAGIALFHK